MIRSFFTSRHPEPRGKHPGGLGWLGRWGDCVLPVLGYFVVFGGLLVAALFLPGIYGEPVGWNEGWAAPDSLHWFGKDAGGRDLLSIALGALARSAWLSLIATVAGSLMGLLVAILVFFTIRETGYRCLRGIRRQLGFVPAFVFSVLVAIRFGADWLTLVSCFSVLCAIVVAGRAGEWLETIEGRGDVIASRALGLSRRRILWNQAAPELFRRVMVAAGALLPGVLLLESAIGFCEIGRGDRQVIQQIGILMASGRPLLFDAPWLVLLPGAALAVLSLVLVSLAWSLRRTLQEPLEERWF